MEVAKRILAKVGQILSHIIFWLINGFVTYYLGMYILFFIGDFLDYGLSGSGIPVNIVSMVLSVPLLLLPLFSLLYVLYYGYIRKEKVRPFKILFALEAPIFIIAITNIFQGRINPGQILILLLFYYIIGKKARTVSKNVHTKDASKRASYSKLFLSFADSVEHVFSLY